MAIYGSIIGDIIGSQYEGERCENPIECQLFTKRCSFTDDTVMSLAVKQAIDTGMDFEKSLKILGRMHPHAGYAGAFEKWLFSDELKAYNSWGNGSAMRVSYIGEYFDELEDVIKWAEKSAVISHNHPEGIKGAVTTAVCVWMAKNGKSKDDIYNYVLKQYPPCDYIWNITKSIDDIKDLYEWDVSCQASVPVAIRAFYESENYIDFIRKVLSLDCDADTLCAIGGGIAEEFYKKTDLNDIEIFAKYLSKDLLHVLYGQYGYIIKNNNRAEGSPNCYWGRTGSVRNNGFCCAAKRNAYVFTAEELESEIVKDLIKKSKKPQIFVH